MPLVFRADEVKAYIKLSLQLWPRINKLYHNKQTRDFINLILYIFAHRLKNSTNFDESFRDFSWRYQESL